MPSGWLNEQLEELIRGNKGYTDVDEEGGWFQTTTEQVRALPDYLAVELTRICIVNLAIRHSGGDLNDFTISDEGMEHSIYRVLALLKESVPG